MSDRADPFPVAQFDAQELGKRFAAQRRWIGLALVLAGLALIVGGIAAFAIYSARANALQRNGVHTTATVTETALYPSTRFTEHIEVSFTTPSGVVQGVRIPLGQDDRFDVGQRVEISYDPANPHRAVFAHGYAEPGGIGFVFFFAIVAGVCVLIYAVRTLRLAHGARRALEGVGRARRVESRLVPDRFRRTALVLDGGGEAGALWAPAGRDWLHLDSIQATVFGTGERGSVVVIVDPQRGAAAGRIWKRRRLRQSVGLG